MQNLYIAILRQIVQEEGRHIFQEPWRFWTIAGDYAGGQLPEELDFLLALAGSDSLTRLGKAYTTRNAGERERLVLEVRQAMCAYYPEEVVDRQMLCFCKAYGWKLTLRSGSERQAPQEPAPEQAVPEDPESAAKHKGLRSRRWLIPAACVLAVLLLAGLAAARYFSPSNQLYRQAMAYEETGAWSEAVNLYEMLGDFRDAEARRYSAMYAYAEANPDRDDARTYAYLSELNEKQYRSGTALYQSIYGWKAEVTAINTVYGDSSYSEESVHAGETVFFYFQISGGPPDDGEGLRLHTRTSWPDGVMGDEDYMFEESFRDGDIGVYSVSTANAEPGTLSVYFYDGEENQIGQGSVEIVEAEETYIDEYADIVGSYLSGSENSMERFGVPTRFLLSDLNGDGLAELIVMAVDSVLDEQYANMDVHIYTVYSGGVVEAGVIQCVNGAVSYGPATGTIHTGMSYSDYAYDEFYRFAEGRVELEHRAEQSLADEEAAQVAYQTDGETVTEAEYQSALSQWMQYGESYYLDFEFGWDVSQDAITVLLEAPDYFYNSGWFEGF